MGHCLVRVAESLLVECDGDGMESNGVLEFWSVKVWGRGHEAGR